MSENHLEHLLGLLQTFDESNVQLAFQLAKTLKINLEPYWKPYSEIVRDVRQGTRNLKNECELLTRFRNEGLWLAVQPTAGFGEHYRVLDGLVPQVRIEGDKFQFPEIFARYKQLKVLILKTFSNKRPPEALYESEQLEQLELSATDTLQLSPKLARLRQLQTLSLAASARIELPDNLSELPNLQSIALSSWGDTSLHITAGLGSATQVRTLRIAAPNLREIPACVGRMSGLRRLELADGRWVETPSALGDLQGLEELCFSSCYKLRRLPEWILGLPRLRGLMLKNCPAKLLHEDLQRLAPTLEWIDVQGSTSGDPLVWANKLRAWLPRAQVQI